MRLKGIWCWPVRSFRRVGAGAFSDCASLAGVKFLGETAVLGGRIFENCEARDSVMLPSKLTPIPTYACCNCKNLRTPAIPQTVTLLMMDAFNGYANLWEIDLPAGITTITPRLFQNCAGLRGVDRPILRIVVDFLNQCFRRPAIVDSTVIHRNVVGVPGCELFCIDLDSAGMPAVVVRNAHGCIKKQAVFSLFF